jgi:hypothetical protein
MARGNEGAALQEASDGGREIEGWSLGQRSRGGGPELLPVKEALQEARAAGRETFYDDLETGPNDQGVLRLTCFD